MLKKMMQATAVTVVLTAAGVAVAGPAGATGTRTCPEGYYGVIVEDPNSTPFFICVKGG